MTKHEPPDLNLGEFSELNSEFIQMTEMSPSLWVGFRRDK